MNRQCIWYISKYVAPPHDSGPGGRGWELMYELANLGYRSVVITSDANHLSQVPKVTGPLLVDQVGGMLTVWLRTFKAPSAKSGRRILSWLHFEWRLFRLDKRSLPRPDVVVVSSLSLLTILNGILIRRRFRARLVFEIRDIWPLTLTEEGGFSQRNLVVRALGLVERLGYEEADTIVGTMPNLVEHVNNILGYRRSVECIPMGFAERTLGEEKPLPEEWSKKYLPAKNCLVVGYAGTIGITNALETFLLAAEQLRHDGVQFLVVGEGPLLETYRERFCDVPNLTFAPKVPKEMVPSVLAHCDVLYLSVYRSRVWDYGQSLNKLIDYMMAGKPIVASYSGHRSMVDEAGCGSFVPSDDVAGLVAELRRYMEMPSTARLEIGARGRSWLLQNRSYRTLAREYARILFPKAERTGS